MIPSAVFVVAVALQNKFPLTSKFSTNPGSMPKTSTHVLPPWGKYMAGFLMKSFWGRCGSTVLMGASCCPSSNYIPVQKIVSLSTELNHNRSALVLYSDNGVCCHHRPHLFIVYIRFPALLPVGQIRLAKLFHPAAKHILPIMKKIFAKNVLI